MRMPMIASIGCPLDVRSVLFAGLPSTVLRVAQIPYGCGPYGPRDTALVPLRARRCSARHTAALECGARLSFIGGAFAAGDGEKAGSKPIAIPATVLSGAHSGHSPKFRCPLCATSGSGWPQRGSVLISIKRQSPPRQLAVRIIKLVPSKTVAVCAGPIVISGGVDMRAHPDVPGCGAD
jgi:hypothetical protein